MYNLEMIQKTIYRSLVQVLSGVFIFLGIVLPLFLFQLPSNNISIKWQLFYAACAIILFGVLFVLDPWIKKFTQPVLVRWILPVLSLVFLTLLVYKTYSHITQITWLPIDDHEIAFLLGPDHKMELGEVVDAMRFSELGSFGNLARFRPVYWLFRSLEAVMWGGHLRWWYIIRLFSLILFAWSFWLVSRKVLHDLPAALLAGYFVTLPFWLDIVARLGPSEIYTVPGLIFFTIGSIRVISDYQSLSRTRSLDWLLISIGVMICVGSKENFLILAMPLIGMILWMWRQGRNKIILFSWLNAFFWIFLVTTAIFFATQKSGVDIHNNPVSFWDRLRRIEFLAQNLTSTPLLFFFVLMLLIIPLFKWGLLIKNDKPASIILDSREILRLCLWLGGPLSLVLSQYMIYSGKWPVGNRYDFPGILFLPLMVVIGTAAVRQWVPPDRFPLLFRTGYSVLTASLVFFLLLQPVGFIQAGIDQQVVTSRNFWGFLESSSEQVKKSPLSPIAFESGRPIDYESIFSIQRFYRYFRVQNPAYLFYDAPVQTDTLLITLDRRLKEISRDGSLDRVLYNDWETYTPEGKSRINPLASFSRNPDCFVIVLSEVQNPNRECTVVGRLP